MEKDYVLPPDTKISQRSVFDLKELYMLMFYWFRRYRYDNFHEQEYLEKATPAGKEIDIRWYADKKINDYVKFAIEIGFLIYHLQDVEIEKEGKRIKTQSGTLEMRFRAYLLKDYERVWERTPMLNFLRKMYDRYILGSKFEQYEDDLYEESYRLINEVKTFLNLHKF